MSTNSADLRNKAIGMLLLANLFWGLSFPLIKALLLLNARLSPGSAIFVIGCTVAPRFLIGSLVLAAWQLRRSARKSVGPIGAPQSWLTMSEIKHGVFVGLFGAVGMLLQNDGMRFTAASTSAFLTQFYAILIPLWLALLHRRGPGFRVWTSCILVMAGVAILGHADWRQMHLGRGELETLLSSVFFMVQILSLENPAHAPTRPEKVTLVWLSLEAVGFGSMAIASAPHPGALVLPWISIPWLALTLLLTAFCTLGTFSIMAAWQPKITATQAGLIYCVEPIFGSVFSLFLPAIFSRWAHVDYPNELASANLIVGGGLITAANVLVQIKSSSAWPGSEIRHQEPP
jgi:drug/metabolite transporter (DMT)-like permease